MISLEQKYKSLAPQYIYRILEKGGGTETFIGESGNAINVFGRITTSEGAPNQSSLSVQINNNLHEPVVFNSRAYQDSQGLRRLDFVIKTRKINGEYHPDFRATEILVAAWNFHNSFGKINVITGRWTPIFYPNGIEATSDNFSQYQTAKERFRLNQPDGLLEPLIRKLAALETWTGRKVSTLLGFSDVFVEEQQDAQKRAIMIVASFYQPGTIIGNLASNTDAQKTLGVV